MVEAKGLDATFELLSRMRGVLSLRANEEQAGLRVERHTVGPVRVDHAVVRLDLDADVAAAGQLIFGEVLAGAVGFRGADGESWCRAGDVYLAAPAGQRRTTLVRQGEHWQMVIDPAFVAQVAETAPGRAVGPVHFTGGQPCSPAAAARWRSTCAYVRESVLAAPTQDDQPLVADTVARLLAATALAVFPNDALTEPTATDRRDASPATVRRAVAFIDEHAQEDISAADIARAACVTIRAVQLAFRRHLDTTPTEYLRRVRLDHAHRQLLAADPARESVTAIAYQWGFPSPSRFAAAYRKAYGVLPSHSLRE
ncbi:MAG TPA: helix-turn-helix transcriptional regulator [Trebonia sp.]|nr:helix-turn-helix transcriptional regulator [Trebonia sp.]